MEELIQWIKTNKMIYRMISDDVFEIVGFGTFFFQDMEKVPSIFRIKDGECVFNCVESVENLQYESVEYIAFKFGNNFYYTPLTCELSPYCMRRVFLLHPCSLCALI